MPKESPGFWASSSAVRMIVYPDGSEARVAMPLRLLTAPTHGHCPAHHRVGSGPCGMESG